MVSKEEIARGEAAAAPKPAKKTNKKKNSYDHVDDDFDSDFDEEDLDELDAEEKAELKKLKEEYQKLKASMKEMGVEDKELEEEFSDLEVDDEELYFGSEEDEDEEDEDKSEMTRILTVGELENLFLTEAPEPLTEPPEGQPKRLQIGLVGYPNVGKSSTINALVGSKKVSVSSTPGKTKHFQTILLSDDVILCDCPGLVFPNFAYTNGELVCNGVLPIDQLREFTGPCQLVAQRIPKYFIEATYGITIPTKPVEEGGNGVPTAQELLTAYARSRGYMTQGFGSADEPRASRYILKDYVAGKLLFVEPPPREDGSRLSLDKCLEFNSHMYTLNKLPEQRKAQLIQAIKAKNLDPKTFDLSKDLDKLTFSSHLSAEDAAKTNNKHIRTHGGKQAALINTADELDDEFFKLSSVKAQ
ncbi:unnamed protein product [Ambrosiozyma monospora]|uniref:Unnamed protein product n=1 Tax=Ambrosiozyma monospora TaxID=43982 RepID=A0ACB5TE27_AMBMO|nr:unnamed protein product [Ambrosiozyma monospora]